MGLGPLRLAPKEGKGWLFAAGELAMPAADLARWDISIMDQKLLKPASYQELETEVRLKNGVGTQYGLGVDVNMFSEHRMLSHGGEVSGFTTQNNVFPDDRAAVVVLTNQDAARASGDLARRISALLFTTGDASDAGKDGAGPEDLSKVCSKGRSIARCSPTMPTATSMSRL